MAVKDGPLKLAYLVCQQGRREYSFIVQHKQGQLRLHFNNLDLDVDSFTSKLRVGGFQSLNGFNVSFPCIFSCHALSRCPGFPFRSSLDLDSPRLYYMTK